jgi:hypothetical protein
VDSLRDDNLSSESTQPYSGIDNETPMPVDNAATDEQKRMKRTMIVMAAPQARRAQFQL